MNTNMATEKSQMIRQPIKDHKKIKSKVHFLNESKSIQIALRVFKLT